MKRSQAPRRIRTVGGLTALVLAATVPLLGAPSAAAGPIDPPPPAPPPSVILDLNAVAKLDWSVPERFDASWDAWRPASDSYDRDFVSAAKGWSLKLNGCASTSVSKVVGYAYTVKQVASSRSWQLFSKKCEATVTGLPAQGQYTASLTLHTFGAGPGVSRPTTTLARIRDYLIVSMGDSLASGEGVPDRVGRYDKSPKRSAVWKDRQCHRSAESGPARAARHYERSDPKTSVTFLSVACTGAKIQHLYDWRYNGIGGPKFEDQFEVISAVAGSAGKRPIDALLMSAGVNNLEFASIVERCASKVYPPGTPADRCVVAGGIAKNLKALPAEYDKLARALRTKLPNTRDVFWNRYPANVFRGGGCNKLGIKWVGIDSDEGKAMHTWGVRLNRTITTAAQKHRWTLVQDPTESWSKHAYCPRSTSWFRSYEESLRFQGDKLGTAHPNQLGHRNYAALMQQAIGQSPG